MLAQVVTPDRLAERRSDEDALMRGVWKGLGTEQLRHEPVTTQTSSLSSA